MCLCNPNCAVYVWLRVGETRRLSWGFKGGLAVIRLSRCGVLHSSFSGKVEGEHGPKTRMTFLEEQRPSLSRQHLDWSRREAKRNKGLSLGLQPGQVMQSSTGNGVQGRGWLICYVCGGVPLFGLGK